MLLQPIKVTAWLFIILTEEIQLGSLVAGSERCLGLWEAALLTQHSLGG